MNDRAHPGPDRRPLAGVPTGSRWPADLTRVCERMAERLVERGVEHPVAAAVVLVARGHLGLDREAFALQSGLAPEAVAAAEAGAVPWEDLPDVVGDLLESMPRVELLALADLDRELRRSSGVGDAAAAPAGFAPPAAEPSATAPSATEPSDPAMAPLEHLTAHDPAADDARRDDGRAAAP